MTVHTPRILTDGETALVSAYEAANFTNRKSARDVAIEALKANGLPTRRIEALHYTDLRALLKGGFSAPHRPADTVSDAVGAAFPVWSKTQPSCNFVMAITSTATRHFQTVLQ